MKIYRYIFFTLFAFQIFTFCTPTRLVRNHISSNKLEFSGPPRDVYKVYMNDGSIYILNDIFEEDSGIVISGKGKYFDQNRKLVDYVSDESIKNGVNNRFEICLDDISIVETNKLKNLPVTMLGITIPGVSLALISSVCLSNPKACFGSCPTFYIRKDGNWKLMAEGFSSSILPSFEESDIDRLSGAEPENNELKLKLTNEALETHVIKYIDIHAIPKKEGEHVFYSMNGNGFYRTDKFIAPVSCEGGEDNCIDMILYPDEKERFTESDASNLLKKEELVLEFKDLKSSELGLVVQSRQTLLTTFLFYQAIGFSGNYYGYFASQVENGNKYIKSRFNKTWNKLGGIEVFMKNESGKWMKIDEIEEMGPIASDYHLIKMPENKEKNISIKLKMTRGLWRINYIALAEISGKSEPVTIHPDEIHGKGEKQPELLGNLHDPGKYMITVPGDNYILNYKLPDNRNYEFFLDSRGYYLEWMRDEWLSEEDPGNLKLLFTFPGLYMRKFAKEFKKVEPLMEQTFWESRYETSM